jgi:hypothetical protein
MAHHTLSTIQIPAGCAWTDEYSWSPVQTSEERSLTGALLIDVGTRIKGRPITLEATDARGWHGMTKAVVDSLMALAATPGATYTLTLADTRTFTVAFRATDGAPITARPLVDREMPPADWPYIVTIRLMEI